VLFEQLYFARDAARRALAVADADYLAVVENIYSELTAAAELAGKSDGGVGRVREKLYAFYVALGHELDPYGLPYARCAGVVAVVRMKPLALLSARDERISHIVSGFNGYRVFADSQKPCDVSGKRDVAALVVHGLFAVYINRSVVVNGAEVQNNSAVKITFAYFYVAPVPHAV